MTAISARAYAKYRGVSGWSVNNWKKLGRVLVLPNGQLDKEKSDAMLDSRPETYRGGTIGGTKPGGGATAATSQTAKAIEMKETYAALSKKLEYERAAGRLVDISVVAASVAEDYVIVRNRLMSVSSKVVPLLLGTRNAEEMKNIIDREVIRALEELSADAVDADVRRGTEDADPAADDDEPFAAP